MDNKERDAAFYAGIFIGVYEFSKETKKIDLSFDYCDFSLEQYKKLSEDEKKSLIRKSKILLKKMEEKEDASTN